MTTIKKLAQELRLFSCSIAASDTKVQCLNDTVLFTEKANEIKQWN